MKASEAKIGEKYLSRTGVTVACEGTERDRVILRMQPSGTIFRVTPGYELKPVNADGKVIKRNAAKPASETKPDPTPPFTMASIIDPFLVAGGHTVAEIAAELGRKAGEAAKGKDLEANVRARLVSYTRKGWRVVKDEMKRVKVIRS